MIPITDNLPLAAVLADARLEHLHAIRNHWGDLLVPLTWAGGVAAVAGVLLAAVALHHWLRRRGQEPRPRAVFRAVARRLGLSLAEQWLLIRIARAQSLPGPLTLLLSRRTLRLHARRWAADLPVSRRRSVLRRVREVRRRLVGVGHVPEHAADEGEHGREGVPLAY